MSDTGISKDILKKKAIKTIAFTSLVIFILGVLYYIFVRVAGFGIPCVVYQLTGYKCPSCGITRMVVHLSKFQFKQAFYDNMMVFIAWPFVLIDVIYIFYKSLIREKLPIATYIFSYLIVGIAVIFCIIRNIYNV